MSDPSVLATHAPDPAYIWRFAGGYWNHKAKGRFPEGPDIWATPAPSSQEGGAAAAAPQTTPPSEH